MLGLGDALVNWSAIWKIVLVALAGGAGVVIVYGFLLLGLKYATAGGPGEAHSEGSKVLGYALVAISAILVVGVIVLGIYAMTQKS